jgi:hypothetical protein
MIDNNIGGTVPGGLGQHKNRSLCENFPANKKENIQALKRAAGLKEMAVKARDRALT